MCHFDDMTVFNNISIVNELSQMSGFNDLDPISFFMIWYLVIFILIISNYLFSNSNNNKKKKNKVITLDEYITKRLSEKGGYNLRSKSTKRLTDEWIKMN